jgi:hypothetical protein
VVELLCGYNQPQKAEGIMSEHENPETPAEEVSIETLLAKVASLESNLAYKTSQFDRAIADRNELKSQISQAEDLVISAVKDEVLDGESEFVTSLAEVFEWELTEEHSVKIIIEVTGTITTPLGKSLEGLEDEIEAEISLSYDRRNDGYDLDLDYGTEVEIKDRGY